MKFITIYLFLAFVSTHVTQWLSDAYQFVNSVKDGAILKIPQRFLSTYVYRSTPGSKRNMAVLTNNDNIGTNEFNNRVNKNKRARWSLESFASFINRSDEKLVEKVNTELVNEMINEHNLHKYRDINKSSDAINTVYIAGYMDFDPHSAARKCRAAASNKGTWFKK